MSKYKRWSFRAAENYMTTAKSARANTRESSSSRWLTKKDLTRDRRWKTAERQNRVNLGNERCIAGLLKVGFWKMEGLRIKLWSKQTTALNTSILASIRKPEAAAAVQKCS
jgi:hypothetical protein